ncbi:MAG: alpha/beta hydrolase-fold protein [Pseudomonadota bacterium]
MTLETHRSAGSQVLRHRIACPARAGNGLGDPETVLVDVYLPPGGGRDCPLLVALAGYGGSGLALCQWKGFEESLADRLDRLITTGAMPPTVVACPDGFNRLGGNQYIKSPVFGDWPSLLADDLVPVLKQAYGCGGHAGQGLFGNSSGGYGALMNLIARPDVWQVAACHCGDMGFAQLYLPMMPALLRALRAYGGEPKRWLESGTQDIDVLLMLAMAASYDPDPEAYLGIRLPVDPHTAQIIPERWQAWLDHDPVVGALKGALRLAKGQWLYIDCGLDDEYNLLYGARQLVQTLPVAGIEYREYEGTHRGSSARWDESLPFIVGKLGAR